LKIIGDIITFLVALQHIYIMCLETFLWRGRALKIFKNTIERANTTAVMAANQGFYNGLLASGLLWGLVERSGYIQSFFLAAVATAGIFGGLTAFPRIFFIQGVPSIIGVFLVQFGHFDIHNYNTVRNPVYGILMFLGGCAVTIAFGYYIRDREQKTNPSQPLTRPFMTDQD